MTLSGGILTPLVDGSAQAFSFAEFPANTVLQFTIRHDGSGVRLTGIDFDASNTTIDHAPYAWSGNTGWVHLSPNTNTGLVVHESYLSGYVYDANTGWIKLGQRLPDNGHTYSNTGTDHGVNQTGGGLLSGYAWSANVGWINVGWAAANDPNAPLINLVNGDFSGYLWSPNIGWINLGTNRLSTDAIRRDDIDADGMADDWEKQQFGNLGTAGVGTDQDGDLQTDAAEYIAGTDANDASSFLKIVSTSYNGDQTKVTIEFTSSPHRIYELQQTDTLTDPNSWSDSGLGDIVGEVGTTTRSFSYPSGTRRFFRARARAPLTN